MQDYENDQDMYNSPLRDLPRVRRLNQGGGRLILPLLPPTSPGGNSGPPTPVLDEEMVEDNATRIESLERELAMLSQSVRILASMLFKSDALFSAWLQRSRESMAVGAQMRPPTSLRATRKNAF